MPELLIKYKSNRTLQLLTDLAKYFDFEISTSFRNSNSAGSGKEIPLIPGNSAINVDELSAILTGKDLDANHLRKAAWKRT
jgi:hypothetical protein